MFNKYLTLDDMLEVLKGLQIAQAHSAAKYFGEVLKVNYSEGI